MLGKLFKNEWLSTWKVPTALSIYLFVITLVGAISFIPAMGFPSNKLFERLMAFSMITYVLSIMGTGIAVVVYFIIRFYKNMYTDEGYLMHTLPVKPYEHILSKGFVAIIWGCLTIVEFMVSLLILALSGSFFGEGMTPVEMFTSFGQGISFLLDLYKTQFTVPFTVYALFVMVVALSQVVSSILMVYASISIGQTFHKHKVGAAFGAFVVLYMILQFIGMFVQFPLIYNYIEMGYNAPAGAFVQAFITPLFLFALLTNIITSAVFYIITERIMKSRLNLE